MNKKHMMHMATDLILELVLVVRNVELGLGNLHDELLPLVHELRALGCETSHLLLEVCDALLDLVELKIVLVHGLSHVFILFALLGSFHVKLIQRLLCVAQLSNPITYIQAPFPIHRVSVQQKKKNE